MARTVWDVEKGEAVEVDDASLPALVQSGAVALPKGDVTMFDGTGSARLVRAEDAQTALSQGFSFASEEVTRDLEMQREYGDSELRAAAEGLARGATLGLSDAVAVGLGADAEGLRERQERNETGALVGEVVGGVAAALATGGTSAAAAAPASLAARAGTALGTRAAASLGGRALVREGVAGAVEGGLQGLGQLVSDAALERDSVTGEKALAAVGMNALLGGAMGGAFGKVEDVVRGPSRAVREAADAAPMDVAGGLGEAVDEVAAASPRVAPGASEAERAAFRERMGLAEDGTRLPPRERQRGADGRFLRGAGDAPAPSSLDAPPVDTLPPATTADTMTADAVDAAPTPAPEVVKTRRAGTYRVPIDELDDVPAKAWEEGRARSIRTGLDDGVKMPPIKVTQGTDGLRELVDGNHRLAIARERGEKSILVRFSDKDAASVVRNRPRGSNAFADAPAPVDVRQRMAATPPADAPSPAAGAPGAPPPPKGPDAPAAAPGGDGGGGVPPSGRPSDFIGSATQTAETIAVGAKRAIEKNPGLVTRVLGFMQAKLDIEVPTAEEWVLRGLDAKKGQLKRLRTKGLDESAPRTLLDDPRFSKVKNGDEAAKLIEQKTKETGRTYTESLRKLDSARTVDESVDVLDLAIRLEREVVAPLRQGPAGAQGVANAMQAEVDSILEKFSATQRLGLEEAERLKSSFDPFAKFNATATPEEMSKADAYRNLRREIKRAVEEKADAISDRLGTGTAEQWRVAKREFGEMRELGEIAKDRLEDAKTANRFFSLTDNITGTGMAAAGGFSPVGIGLGLGAAIVNKWGRENLPFLLARAMADFESNPGARRAAEALRKRVSKMPPDGAGASPGVGPMAAGAPPSGPSAGGPAGAVPTPSPTGSESSATPGAARAAGEEGPLSILRRAAQYGPAEVWLAHTVLSGDDEYRREMEAGGLAKYTPEADREGQLRARALQEVEARAQDFEGKVRKATRDLVSGKGTPTPIRTATRQQVQQAAEVVRDLTRNPELLTQRVMAQVGPLEVAVPGVARAQREAAMRGLTHLASVAPKPPESPIPGVKALQARWEPSEVQLFTFARHLYAVQDPMGALEDYAAGRLSPESVKALEATYPEALADARRSIIEELTTMEREVPYQKRLQLGLILGQPVDDSARPEVVAALQQILQQEPQPPQQRQSMPSTRGALSSQLSDAERLAHRGAVA